MILLKTQGRDKINIKDFIHQDYKAQKLKVFVVLKLINQNIQAQAS